MTLGSGIRDPGSRGQKGPGSGSATMEKTICVQFENGNPLAKLPVDIQLRGRQVFSSVLKYAYELLTLDTMMKVPNQELCSGIRIRTRSYSMELGPGSAISKIGFYA
jgi:hypothetical protein